MQRFETSLKYALDLFRREFIRINRVQNGTGYHQFCPAKLKGSICVLGFARLALHVRIDLLISLYSRELLYLA